MAPRISDMLRQMRRQAFIGREKEIGLFQSMVKGEGALKVLLYIYGPGGQGKTTLLRHLAEWCGDMNFPHFTIDGRELAAHPSAVWDALQEEVGGDSPEEVAERLEAMNRAVLFIDTYEKLRPLDDWFRTDFLPQMPGKVLTVICGRNAPSLAWQADPGWKRLMEVVPLRNFSQDESRHFLAVQEVPATQMPAILQFTYGHPLALSLVTDIFAQSPEGTFSPEEMPGIVRSLLETFLQQTPGPAHRTALEIAAIVQVTTESVLKEVMEVESASDLFDWLRQLSFMDQSREGIYPHDIIREALTADLRWRHPDYYQTLYEKARGYYARRLHQAPPAEQRKLLFQLLYLQRSHPMVRSFFDWQESGAQWVDSLKPDDVPEILEMIRRHEGEAGADTFSFWREHPAAQVWVWRDALRKPEAFLLRINAHELDPQEDLLDEPVKKVWSYCRQHLHPRSGEQVALFRMWMVKDSYQRVSTLQSSIFVAIVQYYFTPGLALSMVSCAHPAFWEQMFLYAGIQPVPELQFTAGGLPFGWYMHDWRRQPVTDWLQMLGRRGFDGPVEEPARQQSNEVLVLSEDAFEEAVAEALRQFHQRDTLRDNPLIQSQLVIRHTGAEAAPADRIAWLKNRIEEEIKTIEASPVDGKYHRVLYRSFINPVGSQERTAEYLNMSFSTYRRYLRAGMERITRVLWEEECG